MGVQGKNYITRAGRGGAWDHGGRLASCFLGKRHHQDPLLY